MPLVGISAREMFVDGKKIEYVNRSYLNKLKANNLTPILLNLDNLENLIDLCDGFLITGGDDIDPVYYNENNTGESKNVSIVEDLIDYKIFKYAVESTLPLLGICKGMQVINVFAGGSLYQDINNDHLHIINKHQVKTRKNRLINLNETIYVNSYHHQAINRIADDFILIATHIDSTIEAIIHKYLPIVGVQWHPELLDDDLIFESFKNLFVSNH